MNIAEQLSLLQNIKGNFKNKLNDIGANIKDDTPFSQYPNYIKQSNKTVFTDKIGISGNLKDEAISLIKDKYISSIQEKEKSSRVISDDLSIISEIDYISLINGTKINTGILQGFAANKYAVLPDVFSPNSYSWEIVVKAFYIANSNNTQWLISPDSTAAFGNILFGINKSGKLYLLIGSNNSSWDIANTTGNTVLISKTNYYFKMEFTGNLYNLYYSTDGQTWINDLSISSSSIIYQEQGLALGLEVFNKGNDTYFLGNIDLTESYIKINDEVWWIGAKVKQIL